MVFEPERIVDCGVDWITTTTQEPNQAKLLLLKADVLIQQETRRGFYQKGWSMSGYHGYCCGRVQAGERPDGAIVRLSSDLAASEWWEVYQITGKASRVDIQATCRMSEDPTFEILKLSADTHRFYAGRRDGPKLSLWTDNNDGATLYIGSRASDYYFRAYNKESESALEEYESCVRLELEIKHRQSDEVIAWLLDQESVNQGIQAKLSTYMDQHGILHKLANCSRGMASHSQSNKPDCLKSLAWLRNQVQPTVQKLREMGLDHQVRESLGLL